MEDFFSKNNRFIISDLGPLEYYINPYDFDEVFCREHIFDNTNKNLFIENWRCLIDEECKVYNFDSNQIKSKIRS